LQGFDYQEINSKNRKAESLWPVLFSKFDQRIRRIEAPTGGVHPLYVVNCAYLALFNRDERCATAKGPIASATAEST